MSFKKVILVSAAFISIVSGCKKSSSSNNEKSNINFGIVEGNTEIKEDANGFYGKGKIISLAPLAGVSSGSHFSVTSKLAQGEDITIHTYSSNKLEGGIDFKFALDSDSKYTVKIIAPGINDDVSSEFASALGSSNKNAKTIRLDVHNDETSGHVLSWIASPTTKVEEGDAVTNDIVGANGTGSFWGVTLNGGRISYAVRTNPEIEEE